MTLSDRIDVLVALGERLQQTDRSPVQPLIHRAHQANQWFTPAHSIRSLEAITKNYLDRDKLDRWIANADIPFVQPRKVALILAGNIPCVGFHDVLTSFICGHHTMIKCSTKDDVLIPGIISMMKDIEPACDDCFSVVERLAGFDAVIATGGDTAATHFQYYFGKYPHIIRKNRNAVAVLFGDESPDQIFSMSHDIFEYFGLGCRSISKLFLPEDFPLSVIFEALHPYAWVIDHHKYKNNYDYNHAIYILGQEPFFTNNFLILKEDPSTVSRIACVHYEYYTDIQEVAEKLKQDKENIQCVSADRAIEGIDTIGLGECQRPGLTDYADGVDTLAFLTSIM